MIKYLTYEARRRSKKLDNVRKDNIEYHQGHVDCGLLSDTFKD